MNYYPLIKPLLFSLPAETSHNLAIWALKNNLVPSNIIAPETIQSLKSELWGLTFNSPLGIAAGFDKNGECIENLFKLGLGFIEVGTATPKPQKGNPKPRLFRLEKDRAIINRLGFNNKGIEHLTENVKKWQKNHQNSTEIIGINIGKNKETQNSVDDYLKCLEETYHLANYITMNISSPNTPGLRELQKRQNLDKLLKEINNKKQDLKEKAGKNTPLIIKIAPDINNTELRHIGDSLLEHNINGVIISNTTSDRPKNLKSTKSEETGGLSGAPLLKKSTQLIKQMYLHTNKKLPIIGVGGISSPEDAFQKIAAGASLVQLYSAFIYKGPNIVTEVTQGLSQILEDHKINSLSEAIGIDC